MGKAPAFQLYAADFYMDTVGWTATEVGAYFRLLMHEWVNGPLPNDMGQLARIAGVDPKTMKKFWDTSIGTKFVPSDPGKFPGTCTGKFPIKNGVCAWENSRLEKTRQEQLKYVESQRDKANSRWNKGDAGASAEQMPEPCSSSSSSKRNNNPPTPQGGNGYPDWLPVETFHEYQTSRKRKLKPAQHKRFFARLKRLADSSRASPEQILVQSIENGWEGIFELKENGNGSQQGAMRI